MKLGQSHSTGIAVGSLTESPAEGYVPSAAFLRPDVVYGRQTGAWGSRQIGEQNPTLNADLAERSGEPEGLLGWVLEIRFVI